MNLEILYNLNPFKTTTEEEYLEKVITSTLPTSYYQQNITFKNRLKWASYCFAAFSVICAILGASLVFDFLFDNIVLVLFVGTLLLLFVEVVKVYASDKIYRGIFFEKDLPIKWFLLNLVIMAASLASSGYGAFEGAQKNAPSAELLATNAEVSQLEKDTKELQAKNEQLESNKDKKGRTYYKLYDSINANTETITANKATIKELKAKTRVDNYKTTQDHADKVKLVSFILFCIVCFSEVAYEACRAYLQYFDYKCYIEKVGEPESKKAKAKKQAKAKKPNTVTLSKAEYEKATAANQELMQRVKNLEAAKKKKAAKVIELKKAAKKSKVAKNQKSNQNGSAAPKPIGFNKKTDGNIMRTEPEPTTEKK